ncbi:MAG TPA: hypothetical protein VM388_07135 [Acidimicrobiales bacterium]|nr:hypothetical protein [Acidimicrobiales bacterium]HWI04067.1 hypothetical protein [Acidimicrobiales bacterium]
MSCQDCGAPQARISLGGVDLCDACFDGRVSDLTGRAPVGPAPEPLVLVGPDGRAHELAFRVLRGPAGIEARLEETGVGVGDGYEFAVLGDHDAEVAPLVAEVEAIARREVACLYLEAAEHRPGWRLTEADEARGRFVWNERSERGVPYDVVIDGRKLSWEEFGEALGSYEGWNFRLVIEDRIVESEAGAGAGAERADAEVIPIDRRR